LRNHRHQLLTSKFPCFLLDCEEIRRLRYFIFSNKQAREYLSANDWDLENAVTDFYPEQDADFVDEGDFDSDDEIDRPSAGRILGDGSAVPMSTSKQKTSSNPSTGIAPKKKFATLGDLGSGDGEGGDPNDSDSDDKPDLFAGGEKSGLAVQNPDDIKRKILEKARK
jgi:UBX domain-containing protein 1